MSDDGNHRPERPRPRAFRPRTASARKWSNWPAPSLSERDGQTAIVEEPAERATEEAQRKGFFRRRAGAGAACCCRRWARWPRSPSACGSIRWSKPCSPRAARWLGGPRPRGAGAGRDRRADRPRNLRAVPAAGHRAAASRAGAGARDRRRRAGEAEGRPNWSRSTPTSRKWTRRCGGCTS